MKISLVRCGATRGPRETNVTGSYPPLGLAYVAAALRAAGHELQVVDAEALGLSAAALLARIPADTGLIGFTSTTLAWPAVRAAAALARRRFPKSLLVIGGPHVTAFPEAVMRASAFDVGVLGDGEITATTLAGYQEAGRSPVDLAGCIIRSGDELRVNLPIPWVRDLDALPSPALDLLPRMAYRSVMVREPFVTMVTSRGCPFRCTFCSQVYSGNTLRTHSPERIVADMEEAVRRFGAREIVLFDETFGVKRDDALRVCSLLGERGLDLRWNARTRIDVLDEELLRALLKAGCYALHVGVESGSQRILDEMNKRITVEQIRATLVLAARLGFRLHAYFMIGWPGETREEREQTLRFSRELPLDWASYTITIPNPLTPLFQRAVGDGIIPADYWERYTLDSAPGPIPFFASPDCTERCLTRAKQGAYLRFYLRPRVLLRNLRFFLDSGGWRRIPYAGYLWLKEELR